MTERAKTGCRCNEVPDDMWVSRHTRQGHTVKTYACVDCCSCGAFRMRAWEIAMEDSALDVPVSNKIRALTVYICDDCLHLRGEMCHEPNCRFCRRTMAEVAEYLDALMIRPIIDGVGVLIDEGAPLEPSR